MDNSPIESTIVEDEEETATQENDTEIDVVASPTTIEAPPMVDCEAKKLARDAKARRKEEKTVQQVLKSLDSLETPQEKLSAMCKKYSELLHENRQLQATIKQSEKNINVIHREKEQFRHERSKAVLAKMRMEQLCRELQKLNKAQLEETALKLRVEEEKRKELCFTFQSAFAEMNTFNNQNNEKSAKMREENMEMREKIKSVKEGIELTEAQLEEVRQQSRLELELAESKYFRSKLELTAEKEALEEDKRQLLLKLAKYHVLIKENEAKEQYFTQQILTYQEKCVELERNVKIAMEYLKNSRPVSNEMKRKMLKLEKETDLWKQRWEKTNAAVLQMAEIKEKRDAEMTSLANKLSTLQELCKVFQRERASLIAQLRKKNDASAHSGDRKALADENRKAIKQFEIISKDCEKLKDNLPKLGNSLSEVVRQAIRATVYDEEPNEVTKSNKKQRKKMKNEARRKSSKKREDASGDLETDLPSEIQDDETGDTNSTSEFSAIEATDAEIEATDAEIATLERPQFTLEEIEKVLGETVVLDIKLAFHKNMERFMMYADNSVTDNRTTEIVEIACDEEALRKPAEISELSESAPNIANPLPGIENIVDLEDKYRIVEVPALENDPAQCASDLITCESDIARNNNETEIPSSEMIEFIAKSKNVLSESELCETDTTKLESSIDKVKIKDGSRNEAEVEPCPDSAPLLDIACVSKIENPLATNEEMTEIRENPSAPTPLLEIRDNVIEA